MKRPDFKYYVIKFLELPYKDIDKYVCIPWSWVRIQRATDRKVVVSYPVENPSDTEKRVKKRQRFSEEWSLYMSVVKYRTDVYEDANFFIRENIYEETLLDIKNEDRKLSKTSEKKPHKSKSNHEKVNSMDTSREYIRLSKNGDTSAIKLTLKQKPLPKPSTQVAEQSSQASVHKDIPIEKSCTQDRKSIEKTAPPESNTQNKVSVNKDSSDQEYQKRSQQEYFSDYLMLLTKLHVSFANMHSMFDQLREAFILNAEVMVKLIKTIENSHAVSNNAPDATLSNNTTTEVPKVTAREENEESDDETDDDESYVDEDVHEEETPNKRKRYNMRKFIVPAEIRNFPYKEDWTLKHLNPAPGIIPLIPRTNLYIDAENLENCKRLSNDCETLARMVLLEIFTTKALSVCSLTSKRRPRLWPHAIRVLLKYVQEYGRERGWTILDTKSLLKILRNKIKEMRLPRQYFKKDC